MANTVSRLSSNGTLILAGNLDEVTFNTASGTSGIKNLFYSSNDFSYAGYSRTIITNATKAPDGTLTGTLVRETSDASATYHGTSLRYQIITGGTLVAGTTYTISLYIKNYSGDRKVIFGLGPQSFQNSGYTYGLFDPAAGTSLFFLNAGGSPSVSMQSVGEGWYRCSVTVTPTLTYATSGSVGLDIQLTNASSQNLYQGNGTSGVYIWGGQVEVASSATIYQATLNGALATPSFAQKIEPSGTLYVKNIFDEVTYNPGSNVVPSNLQIYTSELDNSNWGKYQCTISPNSTIAPDGSQTADKFVENTNTNVEHFYYKSYSFVNTTITGSVYAKAAERTSIVISFSNFIDATGSAAYDLLTGTVITTGADNYDFKNTSATITNVGNGWFRCTLTTTKIGTKYSACNFQVTLISSGTTTAYTGNGTSGAYVWGNQVELNSYATEYVPMDASGVMSTPKFKQRTSSNGINYVTNMFDEFTGILPVSDSIILNLDPSYDSSYSGSGNTWYDATKKYNAPFVNGTPTYSKDNGGILKFAGSFGSPSNIYPNTYANTALPCSTFTPSMNRTMSVWVKFSSNMYNLWAYHPRPTYTYAQVARSDNDNTYGSCGGLISCSWYGGYGLNWYFWKYGGSYYFVYESHNRVNTPTYAESSPQYTMPIADAFDKWHNIVGVYNPSQNIHILYVDGVAVSSYSTSGVTSAGSPFNFGFPTLMVAGNNIGGGNSFDNTLNGSLGQVLVYNRALSGTEVLQNYNALKNRYAT